MNLIVAIAENDAIGKDNKLLWHLPPDLKHFKELTTNNIIVMGRKTLESFPNGKPLPNRINVVFTKDREFNQDGVIVVHSLEEFKGYIKSLKLSTTENIFVIGGASIYKLLLDYCDKAYITRVHKTFEADTYLSDFLDTSDWVKIEESGILTYEDLTYTFQTYINRSNKF